MVSTKSPLTTLLLGVALLLGTISPASAIRDASVSLNRRTFRTESMLANGSGAGHNDQVTPLPTNQSDAAAIVAASTYHSGSENGFMRQKRKDSKSKSKKKKTGKNNNKNSTSNGDDDSGVGRAITLPISLTMSLAILVGTLQI
ncbi:hypothetical protein GGR51DRAFT_467434 [Nemania sp. FL0031]|nr:hypothetical protein GGR51DRAFT_467434 [Nemania sp. FL0031]